MNQFNSLPRAARIGIPAAGALVILLLLYMLMFSGPSTVELARSADPEQIAEWEFNLEASKVKYTETVESGQTVITVLEDAEPKARGAVTGSMKQRLSAKVGDECVAPGQFGTRAQMSAYTACKTEAKIRDTVVSTQGVTNAKVNVVTEDSGSLTGSGTVSNIAVTIFPNKEVSKPLDAEALATRVALMAEGGSPDRVVISDWTGAILWSQGRAASGSTPGGNCATQSSDPITDITTKEAAVKACFEQDVLKKIAEIIGDEKYASVVAGVTLSPAAETMTVNEVTRGALLEQDTVSNNDGSSSSTNDSKNFSPNTTNTTKMKGAGYVDRLNLAVTLDSSHVTPAMEDTVRNFLKGYVDIRRGDPVPSVLSTKFAKQEGGAAKDKGDNAGGATAAPAAAANDDAAVAGSMTPSTRIPRKVMAMAFLLLVGLVTVIALLWRRSAALTADRTRFENEFRNDQQYFQNFAKNDPAALADDLARLLGEPVRAPGS